MTTQLTREDARAVARILYAVHQRRAAREAAQQAEVSEPPRSTGSRRPVGAPGTEGGNGG